MFFKNLKNKYLIITFIFILLLIGGFARHFLNSKSPRTKKYRELPKNFKKAAANTIYDVIVVGGGAAGSMAAYHTAVQGNKVLLVVGARSDQRQSRGMWVPVINNIPYFKNIKYPIYVMRNSVIQDIMDSPYKNNLSILNSGIKLISKKSNGQFVVEDYEGNRFDGKFVILSTGIMDVQPHIRGSIKPIMKYANKQDVIYCLRCDGGLAYDKQYFSIIGNSESAARNAILVQELYQIKNLNLLTNGLIPAWSLETSDLLKQYNISVHTDPIQEIKTHTKTGRLKGFLIGSKEITSELVLINLGSRINNKLAVQLGAKLDNIGFVIANDNGLTSIQGLYVAGDLKSGARKQIYVAWDHAIRASEDINKQLKSHSINVPFTTKNSETSAS